MRGLHVFTLADVPVFVSPWYGLLLFMLFRGGDLQSGILFVVAATVSLLAHEFGHALVAKRYGLRPQIQLHGFGGVTSHARATWAGQEALIVAAGPGAGIVLGLLALLVTFVVGESAPPVVAAMLRNLVYLNFFWSAFNLLPVWPMDGGQLFRLGVLRFVKPLWGERIVHGLALAIIVVGGWWLHQRGSSTLLAIILFMTAMENIQALVRGGSPVARRESPLVKQLIEGAEAAMHAGDDAEAVRLGHQLRSTSFVAPGTVLRMWAVLGVASTRQGKYDEALGYLKRAAITPQVVEAFAQCYFQLQMWNELTALTQSRAFGKLTPETQASIRNALAQALGADHGAVRAN